MYTLFTNDTNYDSSLYAFDLNQRLVRWVLPMQSANVQPVLAGDTVFSVDKSRLQLVAINAITGRVTWTWSIGNFDKLDTTNMVATKDMVFVQSNDMTYAISRQTHNISWAIAEVGEMALGDGKIFITGPMVQSKNSDKKYPKMTVITLQ